MANAYLQIYGIKWNLFHNLLTIKMGTDIVRNQKQWVTHCIFSLSYENCLQHDNNDFKICQDVVD